MSVTHITGSKNKPLMWREAEAAIDAKARDVRARFATEGMDGVYLTKRDEATAYLAELAALPVGETPALAGYPYLAMEAGATAPDAAALAELWLTMNQQWRTAGASIEAIRTAAKAEARAAKSQATINQIIAQAIEQLDEIGPKPPSKPVKTRSALSSMTPPA